MFRVKSNAFEGIKWSKQEVLQRCQVYSELKKQVRNLRECLFDEEIQNSTVTTKYSKYAFTRDHVWTHPSIWKRKKKIHSFDYSILLNWIKQGVLVSEANDLSNNTNIDSALIPSFSAMLNCISLSINVSSFHCPNVMVISQPNIIRVWVCSTIVFLNEMSLKLKCTDYKWGGVI